MRTVALRAPLVQAGLVMLFLAGCVGLASTLYVAFHDDLVAELMRRQGALQYAYEDRIDGLRQDLEHQRDQARADQAQIETRLHELVSREARLEDRAATVASLSGEGGPVSRRADLPPQITGALPPPPPAALPTAALGYADGGKPHPLVEPPARGPLDRGRAEDHAFLLDDAHSPLGDRLGALGLALDRVEQAQAVSVTRIGAAARQRSARIRSLIEEAGLSPDRYLAHPGAAGVGGPFVPLPEGQDGTFGRAVAELRGAVATTAQLENALGRLPLATPLLGRLDVTSPFGARTDPFLGRPALHTGVDLREGYGTDIRATGGGRVVFAGTAGGYGNMVEVDHGNGVTTRYAHMGGIAVAEGRLVTRGAVLGYVGATGRATGPHLHYEVRIDGEPVDPTRFLAGSERLASLTAH